MTDTTPLRVLVVEDHFLARLAITTLVNRADMQVVAEAEAGWQAIDLYKKHRPDLVLMDLRLPEMDGTTATSLLRREDPKARVLILSHYESEEDVSRALAAGALGYVSKDVDGATLLEAIRTVGRGTKFLPAPLAERVAEREGRSQLTRREIEILQLVFEGRSNHEIADSLALSHGTVRIHVSNILVKLEVKRRTEAVALALKKGLLRTR